MKHLFVGSVALLALVAASPAVAADMPARPVYKAPPPVVAAYSWTGCYVGGNAGVAWSESSALRGDFVSTGSIAFGTRIAAGQFPNYNFDDHAFTGGGQIGCNWQFAPNWVWGVEADINYLGLNNDTTVIFPSDRRFLTHHSASIGLAPVASGSDTRLIVG